MFDMCQLGWGVEGQAWSWQRRLFAWEEEMVGKLILLLHSVSLQAHWNKQVPLKVVLFA